MPRSLVIRRHLVNQFGHLVISKPGQFLMGLAGVMFLLGVVFSSFKLMSLSIVAVVVYVICLKVDGSPKLPVIQHMAMNAKDWERTIYMSLQMQRPKNVSMLVPIEERSLASEVYFIPTTQVFFQGDQGLVIIENFGLRLPDDSIHLWLGTLLRGPLEDFYVVGSGRYSHADNYVVYKIKKDRA